MKPIPSFPLKESSGDGSPPSVVYVPVSVAPQSYDPYPKRMSIGLGTTQILLGVLCIVFNTISLAAWGAHYGFVDISLGYGILCGALFIASGSLGVSAGMKKTKCQIVAYMVMCILSSVFTLFLLRFGIIIAWSVYYRSESAIIPAMGSSLAITAVFEAVLFIWGSVLCCKSGACCCSGSYQPLLLTHEFYDHLDNEAQKGGQVYHVPNLNF